MPADVLAPNGSWPSTSTILTTNSNMFSFSFPRSQQYFILFRWRCNFQPCHFCWRNRKPHLNLNRTQNNLLTLLTSLKMNDEISKSLAIHEVLTLHWISGARAHVICDTTDNYVSALRHWYNLTYQGKLISYRQLHCLYNVLLWQSPALQALCRGVPIGYWQIPPRGL